MPAAANTDRPQIDGRLKQTLVQAQFRLRRLDRRRLLAISLAAVAALMTQTALSKASAVEASLGHRTPVVIAAAPLPAGTVVDADQVTVQMWPTGMVPEGTFRTFETNATFVVSSNIAKGEPLTQTRVNAANLGLDPDEVAVTLPQPLARPPLQLGYLVQLVGVTGNAEQFLASATVLTTARIVSFDDDALTVAVKAEAMPRLIEHGAVGVVEVVITPQRG